MDDSCLSVDYITIIKKKEKSFSKNLSFYGKPKGLKDLKKQQKSLESRLDVVTDIQNDFANLTCLNLKLKTLGKSEFDWGFVNPENGEIALDVTKKTNKYDFYSEEHREASNCLDDCVVRLSHKLMFEIYEDPEAVTLKLKDILDYFDRKIVAYGNELLKIQDEIEEVSKPAPVENWRLFFVFTKAKVEVVGQAAKNLYEELLETKSNLNLKMHVKETNQYEENKLILIVDSYEIL